MNIFGIDAGHAGFGVTPGKRLPDGTMYEWDFNNAVAVLVEKKLQAYENVKTVRLDDPTGKRDIPLVERVSKARKEKVTAVVSIHANAFGSTWNDANGIETFISEDNLPSSELVLASAIQNHLIRDTGLRNRGVKRGNLYMTKVANSIPSVLCELGFMTNKEEALRLKSPIYQETCAEAIVKGLVEVFKLKKIEAKKSDKMFYLKTGTFLSKEAAEKVAESVRKSEGIIVHVMEV